jgi:RNA polymerase sigma-70 factor (ECF subfamily)
MARVQRGDEPALNELLERWRPRLFGFLVRRVGDVAAEDLFQETWLRVVRSRDRYDPKRRFSTWLFQIANNLCRDRGRRRKVEEGYKETVREQVQHDAGRLEAPPLDLRMDVHRRLAALPERLREVLILRYYHQLPEADIAEVVGIPRGTVKSRLHSAVRTLRGQMADEEDEA